MDLMDDQLHEVDETIEEIFGPMDEMIVDWPEIHIHIHELMQSILTQTENLYLPPWTMREYLLLLSIIDMQRKIWTEEMINFMLNIH
jgi:hypothetical protein